MMQEERCIDLAADELIDRIILNGIKPANEIETQRAKRAILRYNISVENLKKEPVDADLPMGVKDFIGRVQTSNKGNPTQAIALARLLDDENRKRDTLIVRAVDKGIHAASYQYQSVKASRKKGFSRKTFEEDIRKRLSLEVGKCKSPHQTIDRHIPYVYKAICVLLEAGGLSFL